MNRRLLLVGGIVACAWLVMSDRASAQAGEEACFTSKANAERAQAGLPPMSTDGQLVAVARRHSQEMADSGTIYHNQQLSAQVSGSWQLLGENVGQGPACDSIHQAFMNSPLHRKNIMEPRFNMVGMGVVIANQTIYITEAFMQTRAVAAPAPAPPPPPAAPAPPPAPKPAPSPKPRAVPKPAPAQPPAPAVPPAPPPSPSPAVSVQAGQTARPSPTVAAPKSGSGPTSLIVGGAILALAVGSAGALWFFKFKRRGR